MNVIEFWVDRIEKQGLVVGRNGYRDIPVGFTFTHLSKARVDGPTHALQTTNLGRVALVQLRLEEVHWYRRKIEFVPSGHSAGLLLQGEGLNELRKALAECGSGEYLSLVGAITDAQHVLQADTAAPRGLT